MNREQIRRLAKAGRRRGMGFTRRFSSSRARLKQRKSSLVRYEWPKVDPDATTEEFPDLSEDLVPVEIDTDEILIDDDQPSEVLVEYEPTLILDPDDEATEIQRKVEIFDLLGSA